MAEIETVTFAQVAAEMLWQLEHLDVLARMRIQTGMKGLDEQVNPMRGELVVLGAEQGSGKSTMINTLCCEAAKRGRRVLMFSLEDSKMELRARLLGLAASIPPCESLRGVELASLTRGA